MDASTGQSTIGGGPGIGQASGGPVKLFELRGANLNVTTDQAFTKVGTFTNYKVTTITARGLTGDALIAAGGIYPAAAKAGTALVAAGQLWAAIAALGRVLDLTLAALTSSQTATPILSLTTAAGGAATADVFIYGVVLD